MNIPGGCPRQIGGGKERGRAKGHSPSLFPLPCFMEARGIEPRSELASDVTTTCVGEAFLRSHCPGASPATGSDKPFAALTRSVRAPDHASPILRYVSAASGGLPLTQVHKPKLTQPEPVQSWLVYVAS